MCKIAWSSGILLDLASYDAFYDDMTAYSTMTFFTKYFKTYYSMTITFYDIFTTYMTFLQSFYDLLSHDLFFLIILSF